MNAEIKSKKWLFAGIGLQFAMGYSIGFLVYFFGTLFTGGESIRIWTVILGWSMVAIIAIALTLLIVFREKVNPENKKEGKKGDTVTV
jgi:ferrous iron transport protein B